MNARERILAAIEFKGPDRCPIHHYIFPGALRRHGDKLVDLATRYPDDFCNEHVVANLRRAQQEDTEPDEVVEWQDAWGTVWRRLGGYTSGEPFRPAIPAWDARGSYEFPPHPGDEYYELYAAFYKYGKYPLAWRDTP